MCIFSMLAAMMFASKVALEALPNVHMLGMFTMLFTVVYRSRALIPIYLYALILLLYYGFAPWCVIHLYVWTVLWALTMLIPRRLPGKVLSALYPTICALHGLMYGALCALTQVPIYYRTFSLPTLISYIAYGFRFDLIHAAGNLAFGFLILPLSHVLFRLEKKRL